MLWTDKDFITADDLTSLDSEVAQVAQVEGILLDAPDGRSIIHRTIEACGHAILAQMQQFGGYLGNQAVSANHNAAVMNIGQPAVSRTKVLLTQVVVSGQLVSDWQPIQTWIAYKCLAALFTDAAHRTQNDRYAAKAQGYKDYAHKVAWENLNARGLPVVRQPLPCPGAVYEPGAGTWGTSNVTVSAGTSSGGAWDVAVTWVQAGQSAWVSPAKKQNGESGPSAIVSASTNSGEVLNVSISGLVPPDGNPPESSVATVLASYRAATGWMVYAGPQGGTLRLQTATPLPLTQTMFTFPTDPATSGAILTLGQWPDLFYAFNRTVQRG